MRIIRNLQKASEIKRPLTIALGNFDGVHLGHKSLIRMCVEESRTKDWESCIFTFEPHPSLVIAPEKKIKLINTPKQKYRLISQLGVNNLILLQFNKELAATTPEDFVKQYLVDLLQVKKVFVGFNYSFGQKGRGNPQLLEELGQLYGFDVAVISPVVIDKEVVSSTLIRQKYGEGDIPGAAKLLGYWPCLEGEVISGDKRGGTLLGFPTANISVSECALMPQYGVYAALVDEMRQNKNDTVKTGLPAIVNIGMRPTFNIGKLAAEVHILDFSGDLYHKYLSIKLLRQIRQEQRFENFAELQKQIENDIRQARKILTETD